MKLFRYIGLLAALALLTAQTPCPPLAPDNNGHLVSGCPIVAPAFMTPAPATPTPMPPTPTPKPTATPTPVPCITIVSPLPNAVVSGAAVAIRTNDTCAGVWYEQATIDGVVVGGFAPGAVTINTTSYPLGSAHIVAVTSQSKNPGSVVLGAASVPLTFGALAPTVTPTPIPTPTPVGSFVSMIPVGQTIPSLTGDPTAIAAGVYNTRTLANQQYGVYNDPNGKMGLPTAKPVCCGPLLDDRQAASVTLVTPQSMVEANGSQVGFNNYFQGIAVTNPSGYLAELQTVWNAYNDNVPSSCCNTWGVVVRRVDGACPIVNPTTAEAIQWAANKWGFDPQYGYAEAGDEGDWDNATLGDNGTSSGVFQVADRNANHGWPGLINGSMLARESTCWNADFFFASRWAAFHGRTSTATVGLTGENAPGDLQNTVQTWCGCTGPSLCGGTYWGMIYHDIVAGYCNMGVTGGPPNWYGHGKYFSAAIPISAPAGTVPHE